VGEKGKGKTRRIRFEARSHLTTTMQYVVNCRVAIVVKHIGEDSITGR